MKNRFKVRFAEVVLAGMVALNSFWLPGAINAQTVDDTDQSAQIYLPLVTNGSSTGSTEDPATTIPGQYIVVFHDDMVTAAGVSATAAELAANLGGELLHTYDAALSGFALKLPTTVMTDALTTLQNDTRVSYIEPDRVVQLPPLEVGAVISEAIATEGSEALLQAASTDAVEAVQYNPPWGLDRVDQRALPLNQQYNYSLNGAGVWVFVIDTGIRLSHNEFHGRAVDGVDTVDGSLPAADCHGHGTHVAGTIGGQTYGVAKGVRFIAVRVLSCTGSGTTSGIVAGVNWVTTQRNNNRSTPMVANMSLGGPTSSAIDTAVQNSIAAGVTYVVAAGNNNSNACNYSPARVGAALTVGATGSSDGRASFSNFGSCLDLFAPGVGVLSSIHTSNSASATSSGTSMAAPHVAGAAAIYLQSAPAATPAQVANSILSNATPNVVGTPGTGSPNRLLYVQSTSTTVCSPEYPHLPVVLGTEGDDPNLRGTAQSERICGLNGNDTIYGDQGNDVINGNQGTDTIYGDVGDDLLRGGRDNDTLYGGDGSDTIYGDLGDDVVQGNIGNDTVAGGDGNDTIRGGQNDDTVMGDAGNDLLYGDLGNDILWGGAGADFFEYYSGNGNDLIQDFQWSVDRLRLYNVTISSYTQLGADCQVNLSTGATIRLVNVGTCRNPQ